MVSLWTPFLDARISARWFTWPNIVFFTPVPIATAAIAWWLWNSLRRGRDLAPFASAMGLFAMCYLGLAISLFPYTCRQPSPYGMPPPRRRRKHSC